ncbi:MAG: hypothetical protein H6622_07865 [Halobacteriovoraceae bacterium]|nr:hypothetical protein [Halobacteriovoraceae bacterium]
MKNGNSEKQDNYFIAEKGDFCVFSLMGELAGKKEGSLEKCFEELESIFYNIF